VSQSITAQSEISTIIAKGVTVYACTEGDEQPKKMAGQ
jgi:hypothetical protein